MSNTEMYLYFVIVIAIICWGQEIAWRRQLQHERDMWKQTAFRASRIVDDVEALNVQLFDRIKRATGARKDVN